MRSFGFIALLLWLPLCLQAKDFKELDSKILEGAILEAKATLKKLKKEAALEAKELGKTLKKETALMFSSETLIPSEEILPHADKGKIFDPHSKMASPMEEEIVKTLEVGRTLEPFDEGEEFLQMSQKISSDANFESAVNIHSQTIEAPPSITKLESCEESISRMVPIRQTRHVKIIPPAIEIKKLCQGHTQTFLSRFPTKKSVNEMKKTIKKNVGENIDLMNIKIDGRNLSTSYRHKNPEIQDTASNTLYTSMIVCTNFKTEEILLSPQEEIVTWETPDPQKLKWLMEKEHCYLAGTGDVFQDSRTLIFRCEKGEDAKCQRIRNSGGILKDKECIETGFDGECLTYRKIFELKEFSPLPKTLRIDDTDLFSLEGFETKSEIDPDFGEAISRLAAVSEVPGSIEEKEGDILKAEVFSGEEMSCRMGCSRDYLFDCCGDPKGWLLNVKVVGTKCTPKEKKLWENRKAKKCHYIGTKDLNFGLVKEKIYICFPNLLAKSIQEGGRKQLGITWGTAEEVNLKGFKLEDALKVDMEKVDFSDFEIEMKKSIDTDSIMKKIQSTLKGFNPDQAKKQTENLLKEDFRKCDL